MQDILNNYIKNIVFFVVFINLVEIIIPNGRYRKYINTVLGFVLVFIMMKPLENFIGDADYKFENSFLHLNDQVNQKIIEKESSYYTEKQQELILDEINNSMKTTLQSICKTEIDDVTVEFKDYSNMDFEITKLEVSLPSIDEAEEKKIKNLISDFYNLEEENIYIKNVD